MVRALAERLPVMITPRWVTMEAQPIAIEDVIWSYPFRYPIRNLVTAAFWFIFLPSFTRPPFMI
jgi:hypothetical protein